MTEYSPFCVSRFVFRVLCFAFCVSCSAFCVSWFRVSCFVFRIQEIENWNLRFEDLSFISESQLIKRPSLSIVNFPLSTINCQLNL
jgi:hypothetical protein